jgi:hypothetical protein
MTPRIQFLGSKDGRQAEKSAVFIDCSRLDGSNLMPAETLAHDIKPT